MYIDRLDRRITADGYDKLYKAFRQKKDEIESKLINLEKAKIDYPNNLGLYQRVLANYT